MISIAHRVDRHFAFDEWMQELGFLSLQSITAPLIPAQALVGVVYPSGQANAVYIFTNISQLWPNNVHRTIGV